MQPVRTQLILIYKRPEPSEINNKAAYAYREHCDITPQATQTCKKFKRGCELLKVAESLNNLLTAEEPQENTCSIRVLSFKILIKSALKLLLLFLVTVPTAKISVFRDWN
jgi:hypothetical protein